MGPIAWAIRFARLTWSLLVAWPLILLSALLDVVNLPSLLPSAAHRSGFDNWRIPFLGQIVWTITWGIPPEGGREYKVDDEGILHRLEAKAAPALSTLLFSGRDTSGAHLRSVPIVVPPAPEAACYGVVADGFGGQVVRGEVGATWLWREWAATESNGKETRSGTGDELAKADEKVLIYFVGGGYISGSPLLGPFSYSLLRASPSNTRLLAITYRLASNRNNAFPAALQDALAGWTYLVRERGFLPRNITLVGDSAGGGLSWSLAAYLGVLQGIEGKLDLGLPGGLALFSPWCDLSMSHPSIDANIRLDTLNLGQLHCAVDVYLSNVLSIPSAPSSCKHTVQKTSELLEVSSFAHLGAMHPIYSPSALALHQPGFLDLPPRLAPPSSNAVFSPEALELLRPFSPSSTEDDVVSSSPVSTVSFSVPTSDRSSPASFEQPDGHPPAISAGHSPEDDLHLFVPANTPASIYIAPSSSTPPFLSLLLAPHAAARTRFFIHASEHEIFRDEVALLVASLRAHGLPVHARVLKGGHHGSLSTLPAWNGEGWLWRWLDVGRDAKEVLRDFGGWLAGKELGKEDEEEVIMQEVDIQGD